MELSELTSNPRDEIIGKIGCTPGNCRIYSMMSNIGPTLRSDCPNLKTCLRTDGENNNPYSFCYVRMREYTEAPTNQESVLH